MMMMMMLLMTTASSGWGGKHQGGAGGASTIGDVQRLKRDRVALCWIRFLWEIRFALCPWKSRDPNRWWQENHEKESTQTCAALLVRIILNWFGKTSIIMNYNDLYTSLVFMFQWAFNKPSWTSLENVVTCRLLLMSEVPCALVRCFDTRSQEALKTFEFTVTNNIETASNH